MLMKNRYSLFTLATIVIGGFRGGKGAMAHPKRQKSPFALMNYSFTVANDVNLYLLSIQCASHCIVNSIQSVNSKCC